MDNNFVLFQIILQNVLFYPYQYCCQETTFTEAVNFKKKSYNSDFKILLFPVEEKQTFILLIFIICGTNSRDSNFVLFQIILRKVHFLSI